MTLLRTLRLLILGETWLLPAGVAVVLLAAAGLRVLEPRLWRSFGGVVLLAGVAAVLALSVRRSAERKQR